MDPTRKERLVDSIKNLLEDDKQPVRHTAVQALSQFEETVEVSIPILIDTVIEGDTRARGRAVDTLIAIGEPAVDLVIENLIGCEEDSDARLCGIHVLSEIYHNSQSKQSEASCNQQQQQNDPHGLVPLIKRALIEVVREALTGDSDEAVANGD